MYKSDVTFTDFFENWLNHCPYRHFTEVFWNGFPILIFMPYIQLNLLVGCIIFVRNSHQTFHIWKFSVINYSQLFEPLSFADSFCLTLMLLHCRYDNLKSQQQWQKTVSLVFLSSFTSEQEQSCPVSALPSLIVLWVYALSLFFSHPRVFQVSWPSFSFSPLFGGRSSLPISFHFLLPISSSLLFYYLVYPFSLIRDLSPSFSRSFQLPALFRCNLWHPLTPLLLFYLVKALPSDFPSNCVHISFSANSLLHHKQVVFVQDAFLTPLYLLARAENVLTQHCRTVSELQTWDSQIKNKSAASLSALCALLN